MSNIPVFNPTGTERTPTFKEYAIFGRAKPSEADPDPKIYRMKIFAKNEVQAKSRFWYFLKKLRKLKKANGELLGIHSIRENKPGKIKNFGVWLRYESRTGVHNVWKEYRDLSRVSAVEQMYNEMAGSHRARFKSIQILDVRTIPAKGCKREAVTQFHNSKIKFPLPHRRPRVDKRFRSTFSATKQHTIV
eukprot:TRINITY_DN175_c0_g1_i3.p1 TRINITY_DN175_c0_g1~~TRINITY_DN175_c0_g1_i3.p1  ORF type:complete len:190 (-),score=31.99 TRINITY_DN175_c0_g1_i3:63-632(-)